MSPSERMSKFSEKLIKIFTIQLKNKCINKIQKRNYYYLFKIRAILKCNKSIQ